MSVNPDNLGCRAVLERPHGSVGYFALEKLSIPGQSDIARLPNVVKVLLENVLRNHDGHLVTNEDVEALARWGQSQETAAEIPFLPARVLLQDFTGVPAV
ncbi:MAG TPA: aconitate hydratase, partial [Dehalococcoidia bacterium]|nr:aconitate hydratase [Dehalococcoidia bacterium]